MISIFTKKETKVLANLRVVVQQRIRKRLRSHLAVLQQRHAPPLPRRNRNWIKQTWRRELQISISTNGLVSAPSFPSITLHK
jgi:hypothetical protein